MKSGNCENTTDCSERLDPTSGENTSGEAVAAPVVEAVGGSVSIVSMIYFFLIFIYLDTNLLLVMVYLALLAWFSEYLSRQNCRC